MNVKGSTPSPSAKPKPWKLRAGMKVFFKCRRKWCHESYLNALKHADRVQKMRPEAKVETYYCDHCDGIHVGRSRIHSRLRRELKTKERILRNPGFLTKAPLEVITKFRCRVEELKVAISPSPEYDDE